MYIPKLFEVTDLATLHEFIETHSFATLVTAAGERPIATRVPLLLERSRGRQGTLLGHVARANPQWRSFDGEQQCLAMFDGPHAYVSPSWYANAPAVPTCTCTVFRERSMTRNSSHDWSIGWWPRTRRA